MSADARLDPYQSPSLPQGPIGPVRSGKPGWLTALCVICLVLGLLGLMNTCFGTVGAIFGTKVQSMFQPKAGTPGMPAELEKAQQQLNDDLQAVLKKHYVVIVAFLAFRFVVALGLFVGGLWCLGLKEPGRLLLLAACALALAFELSNAIVQSIVNIDNMTAINSFVENLQANMPADANSQNVNKFMKIWLRIVIVMQIVLLYGWTLIKAAFFVWGLIYLQRTNIKQLFQPSSSKLAPA